MGRGIAEVCAAAGKTVLVIDLSQARLDLAREKIDQSLASALSKGRLTREQVSQIVDRISYSINMAEIAGVDMLIEAVNEDLSTKKKVLRDSQQFLKPGTYVASNTSSLSITELASHVSEPDRFVGLHFMNPVPKMQLVELIRGLQTSDETFELAEQLVAEFGKTAALSEDFPAFIVNRILMPMINEAILALYEGVGNVENIDKAMKLGANHPMGPLELADYIGLDTVLSVLHVLHEGLADPKYRPCPLLNRYVTAGWLGKKSGRGFYDYSGETPVPTR